MQTLAVSGYTADAVNTALTAPTRTIAFRYDIERADGTIDPLTVVTSATIEMNALADIKRTAKFTVDDDSTVNWLSDRLRPYWRLKMSDGGWAEWPLGVFVPTSPEKVHDETGTRREVEAYDLGIVLDEDLVTDRYVVTAGTAATDAVDTVLTAAGLTDSYVTVSTETLPTDRDWPPGTSRRHIINSLLASINYRPLTFDANGFATSGPYQPPTDRPTGHTYTTSTRSVVSPDITVGHDLFGVANTFVGTVSDPERPALRSTYTNTSPSSPTSTVSRGRTIVDYRELEATSQTALDATVARLAFEASQIYQIVDLSTATMPHHDVGDVLEVVHVPAGISARFTEHTWSLPLKVGASMSHRIRRVVTV